MVLRVIVPDSSSRTGSLLLVGGDSLLLYDPRVKERFVVHESFAGALEVYRGHQAGGLKPAAKGAGKGALIGAGVGALLGGVVPAIFSSGFWEPVNAGKAVASGALLGAAEGASMGALQGALRGDAVWERVTFWQLRQELCRCDNPKKP